MISRRNATTIAGRIEAWFRQNARELPWRAHYDPYHVWISEFMAQQTRMEVVLRHLPRFIERFPSVEALADASEEAVVAAWSGLGYYRRARMLHRSARELVGRFGGRLPDNVDTLRTLHGFGPYTAGAVASIAYERRVPLVDGNVARIVSRLEALEAPWRSRDLDRRAWEVAELLVEGCMSPRDLNQGLMELGAGVCRPKNPGCDVCPIVRHCQAAKGGNAGDYPRPAPKTKTVDLEVPVWIFTDRKRRVLMRRSDGRLMKGMFQLPVGVDGLFGRAIVVAEPGPFVGEVTHTITHRRIRFRLHLPRLPDTLAETEGEWLWIAPEELSEHPHPSWVKKALEKWAGQQ